MPWKTYREPQTMLQALDRNRPGRVIELQPVPGNPMAWAIRLGEVLTGFLSYDGSGTWHAEGVLTKAEATGCHRDSVVQSYMRRLRDELLAS